MQDFIQNFILVIIEESVDYNMIIFFKLIFKCSVFFWGWCYKVLRLKIFCLNFNKDFEYKKILIKIID